MPQTIIDLGRAVKQKHPGYADLSDDELGRKIKAKFPGSYDDFMDAPPVASPRTPPDLIGPPEGTGPGFFGTMANQVMGLPAGIWHSLTTTPISEASEHTKKLFDDRGLPNTPFAENEWRDLQNMPVPSPGEMAGHVAGMGVNTALLGLVSEGLESPMVRGAAGGAMRSLPTAAKHAALPGFGAVLGHGTPIAPVMEAVTAARAIPDIYRGAVEGQAGRLPLGPVGRSIRDAVFPPPPREALPPSGTMAPIAPAPILPPDPVNTNALGPFPAYEPPAPLPAEIPPAEMAARLNKPNIEAWAAQADQLKAARKGGAEFVQAPVGIAPRLAVAPEIQQAVLPQPLTPPVAAEGGLFKNLTKTVKSSADRNAEIIAEHAGQIGHELTSKKNATIAGHLLENGIDATKWEALTPDQKNDWVKKVNTAKKTKFKPFGADYREGGYGRPAEEGHRQVADALRVLGTPTP